MVIHDRLVRKIADYHVAKDTTEVVHDTPIVLLVGIAGAGKDTIKHELLKTGKYHHIVSHTTRKPRENQGVMERDGVEYHFIDYETAEKMLDNQEFVEAKLVHGTDLYGTSIAEIQIAHDQGEVALTDLEVQGVDEYMAVSSRVKPIFILPPSYDTWQQRLLGRYGDDHANHSADITKRMHTAKIELEHLLATDYFYLIVNQTVSGTVSFIDRLAQDQVVHAVKQRPEDLAIVRELLNRLDETFKL